MPKENLHLSATRPFTPTANLFDTPTPRLSSGATVARQVISSGTLRCCTLLPIFHYLRHRDGHLDPDIKEAHPAASTVSQAARQVIVLIFDRQDTQAVNICEASVKDGQRLSISLTPVSGRSTVVVGDLKGGQPELAQVEPPRVGNRYRRTGYLLHGRRILLEL